MNPEIVAVEDLAGLGVLCDDMESVVLRYIQNIHQGLIHDFAHLNSVGFGLAFDKIYANEWHFSSLDVHGWPVKVFRDSGGRYGTSVASQRSSSANAPATEGREQYCTE